MRNGASLIFLESLRERYPSATDKDDLEARIVVHEVGHALTLDHGDNTDNLANNGVMNRSLQFAPTAQIRFIDKHLDVLRKLRSTEITCHLVRGRASAKTTLVPSDALPTPRLRKNNP